MKLKCKRCQAVIVNGNYCDSCFRKSCDNMFILIEKLIKKYKDENQDIQKEIERLEGKKNERNKNN
jgi:hypothetical protein